MKPIWHTGSWTGGQDTALITELQQAKLTRSLTKEEFAWLSTTIQYRMERAYKQTVKQQAEATR